MIPLKQILIQYIQLFNLDVELAAVFGFELCPIGLIIVLVLFKKKQQMRIFYTFVLFLAQEDVKCVVGRPETA